MESKRAKELAEAHWNGYVGPLTANHATASAYTQDEVYRLCEFHYRTALAHGHRHGVEDERNGLFRPRIGEVAQYAPAHPYLHKDELSPSEAKAIAGSISPPSLCGTCIRQGCPLDCAEHTTECGEYLPQGGEGPAVESKQWVKFPEFHFSFPPAEKFIGRLIIDYVAKLHEEVNEVANAQAPRDRVIELLDVIHAAETAIRSQVRDHGLDIQDLADHVVAKNRQRGYYTKG